MVNPSCLCVFSRADATRNKLILLPSALNRFNHSQLNQTGKRFTLAKYAFSTGAQLGLDAK
jgi:hypothetical protein